MREKNDTRRGKGGRPPKTDTATNHVMVRFTDEEYVRFLTMYEESGMQSKGAFAKARVFNESFRVIRKDRGTMEYAAKLTQSHAQFRAIGVNYNQTVKEMHTHFSEKKALALLYKLEKQTGELAGIGRLIVELSEEFLKKW